MSAVFPLLKIFRQLFTPRNDQIPYTIQCPLFLQASSHPPIFLISSSTHFPLVHCAPTTLVSLLFLEHVKKAPALGPLHLLFPPCLENSYPQRPHRSFNLPQVSAQMLPRFTFNRYLKLSSVDEKYAAAGCAPITRSTASFPS